jgi:PA domain.
VISSSLSVNGKSFELTKDYLNNNGNYSSEIPFSEVVFAGYGIVDDKMDSYKDLDVRGKAVLIIEGTPADYKSAQTGGNSPGQTFGKLQSASKKGAVAVLLVSKSFGTSNNRPANNRGAGWSLNGYKANFNPQLFYISEKVAAEIMGKMEKEFLIK